MLRPGGAEAGADKAPEGEAPAAASASPEKASLWPGSRPLIIIKKKGGHGGHHGGAWKVAYAGFRHRNDGPLHRALAAQYQ